MFSQYIKLKHVSERISKLRKYEFVLNQCEAHLKINGYSLDSIRHYRCALEHFLFWKNIKHRRSKINPELVDIFLKKHIPTCQCPIPAPKRLIDLIPALKLLLKINNECGINLNDKNRITKTEKIINNFDNYLKNVCGHCERTRYYHRYNIKIFLNFLMKNTFQSLKNIKPIDVRKFLYQRLDQIKRKSVELLVYSLRCFFKYLIFSGINSKQLIITLPSFYAYKRSDLPEYLKNEEVEKLLNSFDLNTALGKREYAVSLCMLEIGLRASEVANMTLDDINWHDQTITLPRGKTRQSYVLPITTKLRDALIVYLQFGRPKTAARQVFVYHRAPVGKGILPRVVTETIRRALLRAGIKTIKAGSHILRRTFATNLLKKGASIKEIADLLRHKSIITTSVYTKVDFEMLSQVALPWPGARP